MGEKATSRRKYTYYIICLSQLPAFAALLDEYYRSPPPSLLLGSLLRGGMTFSGEDFRAEFLYNPHSTSTGAIQGGVDAA